MTIGRHGPVDLLLGGDDAAVLVVERTISRDLLVPLVASLGDLVVEDAELVAQRDVGLVIVERRQRDFRSGKVERETAPGLAPPESLLPELREAAPRQRACAVDLDPARHRPPWPVGGQIVEIEPFLGVRAVIARIFVLELEELRVLHDVGPRLVCRRNAGPRRHCRGAEQHLHFHFYNSTLTLNLTLRSMPMP